MNVKLVLFKSTENQTDLVIAEPVTVLGRGRSCQIQFVDSRVSRHHCQLTLTAEKMLVRDLGSANGTYVNRTLIEGEVELAHGDTLTIGRYVMTVQMGESPESAEDRPDGDLVQWTEELPGQSQSDTHDGLALRAGWADGGPPGPDDADRREFVTMAEEIRLVQQEATRELEYLADFGIEHPPAVEAEAAPAQPPVIDHPATEPPDDQPAPQVAHTTERIEMPPGLDDAVEPTRDVDDPPHPQRFDLRPIFDDSEDEDRIDPPESVRRDAIDEALPDDAVRPPGHAQQADTAGEAVDILDEFAHEQPNASPPVDWSASPEAISADLGVQDDEVFVDVLAQIERQPLDSDLQAAVETPPREQETPRDRDGVDVFGEAAAEDEEDPMATLERLAAERVQIRPAREREQETLDQADVPEPVVEDRSDEDVAEPAVRVEPDEPAVQQHAAPETHEEPSLAEHPSAAIPMPPVDSGHPGEDMQLRVDRPLHEAARRGERGLVSLFLSKGAKADLPVGPHGATALHYAAGSGQSLIVDLLLARGADVNALDQLGATPLFWARRLGHDAVARSLLQQGADPAGGEDVEPS